MSADDEATREQLVRRARERLRAALADEDGADDGVRSDLQAFLARLDAVGEGTR